MQIARHDLTCLLSHISKVIQARNTIPILSNVAITVANGALTVRGTDLDIEVLASMPLDAPYQGFTVDAKLLGDIAKKAGDDIHMELKDGTLHVRSGKSRFRLPTLPIEDFPSLAAGEFTTEFEYDLAALVAPVAFAQSNEATRYYLNGVYMHPTLEGLTVVATDGHRLAKNVGAPAGEFTGVIIPSKLVGLLPKGVATIRLSDRKIQISADETIITGKLIDGTFPDYARVIPQSNSRILTVDRDALLTAVERVSVVAGERGKGIGLEATDGALSLNVSAGNQSGDDQLGELTIGFNPSYICDELRVLAPGAVRIALNDSGSPAVLTGGNAGLTLVCMPMRA